MGRLIKAFFLHIFILIFLGIYIYSSSRNLIYTLLKESELYIPIAGTSLLIALMMKKKLKDYFLLPLCFLYIILITGFYFSVKEFIIPSLQKKNYTQSVDIDSSFYIILKEFDHINALPQKIGMLIQDTEKNFIFGKIAQQNNSSYLIMNAFVEIKNEYFIHAQYAKIIQNTLVLYKATLLKYSNNSLESSKELPKNYQIPISFDIESLFYLWNASDLRIIKIIPIILYKLFTKTFLLCGILAISQYLLAFISLSLICLLGLALYNTLDFSGIKIIGGTALLVLSYPATLLLYYYLSLIIQSVINNIII